MGELFWSALPTYLAIGMTAEEFWHGEPRLARAYREADLMRREREAIAEWRQGAYVLRAIASALSSRSQYPEEPLFLPVSQDSEAARELARGQSDLVRMEAFAASFNARFSQ